MNNPLVSIHLPVYNERKRIKQALLAVFSQTYKNIEVLVFDNNSSDDTVKIVQDEFPKAKIFKSKKNLFVGPANNEASKMTTGKYIVSVSADVVIAEDFIEEVVKVMESDLKIGALQAKILHITPKGEKTNIIDTTGFKIYKSRRLINRGHGEEDKGQYDAPGEIFAYEGAVPVWRREAFLDCSIPIKRQGGEFKEAHDEDFVWMSDDVDFGWRMNLFGWKNYYTPKVLAWHERQTTQKLSSSKLDFIKMRRDIRDDKKTLDILNYRLTILKNDFSLSLFKNIFPIFKREIMLFLYFLIFEQRTLLAYPKIIAKIPKILKKRKYIMKHKKRSRQEMEKWFI